MLQQLEWLRPARGGLVTAVAEPHGRHSEGPSAPRCPVSWKYVPRAAHPAPERKPYFPFENKRAASRIGALGPDEMKKGLERSPSFADGGGRRWREQSPWVQTLTVELDGPTFKPLCCHPQVVCFSLSESQFSHLQSGHNSVCLPRVVVRSKRSDGSMGSTVVGT